MYVTLLDLPPVTVGSTCQVHGSLSRVEQQIVLDALGGMGFNLLLGGRAGRCRA